MFLVSSLSKCFVFSISLPRYFLLFDEVSTTYDRFAFLSYTFASFEQNFVREINERLNWRRASRILNTVASEVSTRTYI